MKKQHKKMESSSKTNKKLEKTRRCWSQREEEVLIACLKDIVTSGWKAGNGFRVGYLSVLEKGMTKAFPGTDLRATPHINSKIHVWKIEYGTILLLFSYTGVGWNDITKMIDANEDIWDAAMKRDKNARLLGFKSLPYYHDWCEIFGKDRATGEQAEDVMDAVNELLNTTSNNKDIEETIDIDSLPSNPEDETIIISTSQPIRGSANKKSGRKKRKSPTENEGIYELLGNFCRSIENRLGEIARRIGYEQDVSAARNDVFEAMGKIGGLTLKEKLVASRKILKHTEDLELFSSLSE